MHRVLLVELAAVGRFHRAVQFPYLAGLLDSAGTPFQWLRFAVRPERDHGTDGIDLEPSDAATLRDRLASYRPDRVVFSRFPAGGLLRLVRDSGTSSVVHVLGDTYASGTLPVGVALLGGSADDWRELAGAPRSGGTRIVPSFAYEPANAEARTLQPLPYLVFGSECTYERPLSSHPMYRELDLSSCVRAGGCAFCNRPAYDPSSPRFTDDDARIQLQALRRTLPAWAGRLQVRLVGEPALLHVETVASLALELGLLPADWLLDSRADRLVTSAPLLARACARLEGSGHRIHVALVGVESFVRADLERMNKGTTPLQNLDAALVLQRLERDHPDSFSFRTFGGLSTIFFTPWTTLEDLAFNLRVVQQCGLAAVAGKVLGDRLRLEPGLPITLLARRDGLVVDRYDDPALDTAARSFYGTELPWRFHDTRLEPLSRLLVRLLAASCGAPVDDPLGRRVQGWWTELARQRCQPIDAALRLVDTVESMGRAEGQAGALQAGAILDAYERAAAAKPPPLPGADQVRGKAAERDVAPGQGAHGKRFGWAAHLVALCHAGLKPVSKIEPLQPDEADMLVRELAPPNPRTRTFESPTGGRVSHLFFGESADKVDAAIEWTARGEDDPSDELRDRAVCEAGKLLGYPSCCAEAFAFKETPRSRLSYAWMHLHRRMQARGEVDALTNPWASTLFESYVPCSLDCPATLELLRGAERIAREVQGDGEVELMLESCARPWLVVLSGQGSALELIPEQEPGERFRYRAGRIVGQEGEIGPAAQADEVVIEHERLRLLRQGSVAVDLSMRAFVWWHKRAWQPELWTRVLALREFMGRDHHGGGRAALDVDGGLRLGPQMAGLLKLLTAALGDLARGGKLQRIRVVRLRPVSAGMLSLELSAAGRLVELYVADARRTTQEALKVGPFALMRPEHQSLEDPVDKAAVQALSAQLSAWLVARQRALRQQGRGS